MMLSEQLRFVLWTNTIGHFTLTHTTPNTITFYIQSRSIIQRQRNYRCRSTTTCSWSSQPQYKTKKTKCCNHLGNCYKGTMNYKHWTLFLFHVFLNILSFIYFKWYPPECKELIFGLYGSTKWEHVAQCDVIFPGFVVEIMWDKCKFWKPVSTTKCDQPDLRSWKSFRFMPRWYENIIGTAVSSSLFVCSCGSINEFIVLVQSKHHLCSANILFDN